MNMMTELLAHLCSSNANMTLSRGVLFSVTKTSTPIPCPVDHDNTAPLIIYDWCKSTDYMQSVHKQKLKCHKYIIVGFSFQNSPQVHMSEPIQRNWAPGQRSQRRSGGIKPAENTH